MMNIVAIKMLIGDRAKYYGLIFGITVATYLMAQQVAIFFGVLDRTANQITDVSEANVWVMQPNVEYIDELKGVRDIDLYRVRGVSGVQWAVPFFKGAAVIQAPGVFKQTILLGVDDVTLIGKPPKMLAGKWQDLSRPNTIIIDKAGWELIWGNEPYQLGRIVEISDQRMIIVGICDTSAPFLTLPIVYTRFTTATKLAAKERNLMTFILVRTKPGYSTQRVVSSINQQTQLQALEKNDFEWRSIKYYLLNTGIPLNFGITIALGFIIGAAVAGQTFYLFVVEHLKQFAALKAMGVSNRQILNMVLIQACMSGFIGFCLGIGLTSIYFRVTMNVTFLRGVYLTFPVALGTAVAIVVIMILSSLASIKKVLLLEPAQVFTG